MRKKNILIYGIIILFVVGLLAGGYFSFFYKPYKFTEDRSIKIVWVNSYHPEYEWTDGEYNGFKDFLDDENINYEMKIIHMDTKRKPKEEFEKIGENTIKEIDKWQPDLIYITDDNAQKYVGMHYVDGDIPMVFAGVNAEATDYGYDKAKNVAGLLERELFSEGIDFLKTINPSIKKIGVIYDVSPTSSLVAKNLNVSLYNKEGIESIEYYNTANFEDYKNKVLEYNQKTDVLVILTILTIRDKDGVIVAPQDVIKWTVENSQLLELTSLSDNVRYGTLLAIEATGHQTGYEAGRIAKKILLQGVAPQTIGSYVASGGQKYINLARAKDFDLDIPSAILVNSEVYETFPWENKSKQ